VVTNDFPLAVRYIKNKARAVGPSGHVGTGQYIGTALSMRDLNAHQSLDRLAQKER